jgi:hypothetical protein
LDVAPVPRKRNTPAMPRFFPASLVLILATVLASGAESTSAMAASRSQHARTGGHASKVRGSKRKSGVSTGTAPVKAKSQGEAGAKRKPLVRTVLRAKHAKVVHSTKAPSTASITFPPGLHQGARDAIINYVGASPEPVTVVNSQGFVLLRREANSASGARVMTTFATTSLGEDGSVGPILPYGS